MFLLLILFGLAALGLALALYIQADIPQKPLPPVKPPVAVVQPAVPPQPQPAVAAPEPEAAMLPGEGSPSGGESGVTSAAPGGDAAP